MAICKQCAKKGEKIELIKVNKTMTLTIYLCPKCNKRVIIERK